MSSSLIINVVDVAQEVEQVFNFKCLVLYGLVVQLEEHSVCTREVRVSTTLRSTICELNSAGRVYPLQG